ncbi:DUF1772 domain-containing protein [Streptomyces sp. MST-110588]|uniref:DUF1772 domain-containing protein n=1 Tax=Streptomyces sp. MST-110588 TaxID=2833628 RepID=UPI001F5D8CDC|nr:DUF1772 domain-containing protein [Streptomyces sp. MST-110588]UNO40777.1 DUF1772 domain-containing protein [Streptomyces sp. MST-110588]
MTGYGQALAALAALANGTAAGIMLATVIGIVPMFLALPYGRYVETVQFLRPRFDPVMPVTNGLALVLDVVLAAGPAQGTAAAGYALAAVLQATVMGISVSRNVPVNRMVMALDAAQEPADWARIDPRRRWRNWNLVRTLLALTAFAVNVVVTATA